MIAVYPGSFDPLTNGHADLICRASKIFPDLVVAVAKNPRKKTLFSAEERVEMIEQVMASRGINVKAEAFEGLLVKYLKEKNSHVVIRGLRAISDFEYEFQMALTNRLLLSNVDTFFLMASEKFVFLSSGMVKEIAMFGGDVSEMVPKGVKEKLNQRINDIQSDHLGEAPTLKT
jgi:pantetheine-phosphate adenylyltransferase